LWFGSDGDIKMMTRARERLERYCPADRAVLEDALSEALKNPHCIADYNVEFQRLRTQKEFISIHTFRFRNARFVIVATNSTIFIHDMWIERVIVFGDQNSIENAQIEDNAVIDLPALPKP